MRSDNGGACLVYRSLRAHYIHELLPGPGKVLFVLHEWNTVLSNVLSNAVNNNFHKFSLVRPCDIKQHFDNLSLHPRGRLISRLKKNGQTFPLDLLIAIQQKLWRALSVIASTPCVGDCQCTLSQAAVYSSYYS